METLATLRDLETVLRRRIAMMSNIADDRDASYFERRDASLAISVFTVALGDISNAIGALRNTLQSEAA